MENNEKKNHSLIDLMDASMSKIRVKNRDMKDTIKDTISWLNKGEEK